MSAFVTKVLAPTHCNSSLCRKGWQNSYRCILGGYVSLKSLEDKFGSVQPFCRCFRYCGTQNTNLMSSRSKRNSFCQAASSCNIEIIFFETLVFILFCVLHASEIIINTYNNLSSETLLKEAIYRVIHKSLRDFRTRLRNNQDRHGRKEHINR